MSERRDWSNFSVRRGGDRKRPAPSPGGLHRPAKMQRQLPPDVRDLFSRCKVELDALHDRRERIVKTSRDITAASKKLIFALHRLAPPQPPPISNVPATSPPPPPEGEAPTTERDQQLSDAAADQAKIVQLLRRVHAEELRGQNYYRLRKSIQPGLEEYIEAAAFLHFCREAGGGEGALVTRETLLGELNGGGLAAVDSSPSQDAAQAPGSATMEDEEGEPADGGGGDTDADKTAGPSPTQPPRSVLVPVSAEDYALGVADLSGEVMRSCINLIAQGEHAVGAQHCAFLRELAGHYATLQSFPALKNKLGAMKSSVAKVESATFNIKVRGSEYPQEMWQEVIAKGFDAVGGGYYDDGGGQDAE
ncbi:Translin family-domain-containing protein [Zopfochytrium polystomum]|nr:Translin family-domain-containing protein [Zopfochytrium polystomum]